MLVLTLLSYPTPTEEGHHHQDDHLNHLEEDALDAGGNATHTALGPVRWEAPESLRRKEYRCVRFRRGLGKLKEGRAWRDPSTHLPYSSVNNRNSEKTDAFSFGVCLYEMVARSLPWKGLTHAVVAHRVLTGKRLAVPINADPALAEVMRRCWEQDPARRPNFEFIYRRLKVKRERGRWLFGCGCVDG
jgi:serine/threonine protein kinase